MTQPDKLFHDKLENFQRPAPAAAWERIESGLNKSHTKGLWMKIAAGLLLLAVAAFLLWPTSPSENLQQATTTNTAKTNPVEKNNTEKISPELVKQNQVQQKATSKNKFIKKDEPVLKVESTETKNENNVVPVIEPEVQVAIAETNSTEKTTSRTIVYTAEEVNAKFLRKKSTDEATSGEKKSSGIQKLMGLASTLKNNENGIGDLRQKKDEILALNFLSNEDKTNKEKN